jgi:hypothetical protein
MSIPELLALLYNFSFSHSPIPIQLHLNSSHTPPPFQNLKARVINNTPQERARRAAAAEQRLASQAKKKTGAGTSSGPAGPRKKNETALEQASRENKGWRDADVMADLRAYN